MTVRFLQSEGLSAWLDKMSAVRRVLAPRREGKSVVFRPWASGDPLPLLTKATIAPKSAVLPACETLVRYKSIKDPSDLFRKTLILDVPASATPTLLFACRPCDARGIFSLDIPYLHGKFKDPYYAARREATIILSLTCDNPTKTCFCTWVNAGPASPEGSDVLMTAVEGGWILEAVSARGKDFLSEAQLPDGDDKMDMARTKRSEAAKKLMPRQDFSKAPERLKARFTDMEFWTEMASKCLSCGACTYMCPTCQCFTITDEGDPAADGGGMRLRSWDYCMSPMFTREASGYNPRLAKAQRMRNRVNHKYWYTAANTDGKRFSCTGCGRCIAQCPVSLDIREILTKAIAE